MNGETRKHSGIRSVVTADSVFQLLLFAFFLVFLFYPIGYVFRGALQLDPDWRWALAVVGFGLLCAVVVVYAAWALFKSRQRSVRNLSVVLTLAAAGLVGAILVLRTHGMSFELFRLLWMDTNYRTSTLNSFAIGLAVVVVSSGIAFVLAMPMSRYRFRGKSVLSALIMVPLIMPPFVGAIGVHQFLTRYGSLNLLLIDLGLVDRRNPIDWLGEYRFWGVVFLESLHLYPILYLNLLAALTNLDATLEEAARNLGARGWRLFRDVTFPLILPGFFAGGIIVFIWAFTDLGTPLLFGYREALPVKIFDLVFEAEANPMGYALVLFVLLITVVVFVLSRLVAGRRSAVGGERGSTLSREQPARRGTAAAVYALMIGVTLIAILPHLGVILKSTAAHWSISVLPERYTLRYFDLVFRHPLSMSSIRMSLMLSILSTAADIVLGFLIAYYLMRKRVRGRALLDIMSMLPLALPGLVLAFGYVQCFAGISWLDPRVNPILLLVIGYTVRRLPFTVRAAVAGFQQTSVSYEEASANLGARPTTTIRRISIPLIFPNLVAGGILAFAFAMLEVSESLMLAFERKHYPIAKAIYTMEGRIDDGPFIACAMGVLGMLLLLGCFVVASRFLGRRLGDVFRL